MTLRKGEGYLLRKRLEIVHRRAGTRLIPSIASMTVYALHVYSLRGSCVCDESELLNREAVAVRVRYLGITSKVLMRCNGVVRA